MKPYVRKGILISLLCLTAGAAGFGLARIQPAWAGQTVPSLEYFIPPPTFSEIENAKGVLEAASSRLIMQVRLARGAGLPPVNPNGEGLPLEPADAITVLEQGLEEFKGTGEEFRLVQELLILLNKENRYGRWLDLYLETLRRHPTHELIAANANQAVGIASAVGRDHELARTFMAIADAADLPSFTARVRNAMASLESNSPPPLGRDRNPCHL